jgi:hypothetical protein
MNVDQCAVSRIRGPHEERINLLNLKECRLTVSFCTCDKREKASRAEDKCPTGHQVE